MVYSTRRFVLCLALCYFVLVFFFLLALRLPRLGKRELILVLFVRLFDLRLFGFVCFLFLLVSDLGRAAICDCGTHWAFLLSFSFVMTLSTRSDKVKQSDTTELIQKVLKSNGHSN